MNTMAPMDEKLVARTLAGDRNAFRTSVDRHYVMVLRLCRSILRHSEDAEDAAQEIFVRAYQALAQFQGRGAFAAWLRRLTVNHCFNRAQCAATRVSRQSFSLDLMAETLSSGSEDDPEECVLRAEERGRIQAELQFLPTVQRTALALRLLEGLSYEEIAEVMGVPVNSVRSWLHRGRTRLRETLHEVVEC